ncbi:unnamed protein product [Arctogadus glacialis]
MPKASPPCRKGGRVKAKDQGGFGSGSVGACPLQIRLDVRNSEAQQGFGAGSPPSPSLGPSVETRAHRASPGASGQRTPANR